MQALYQVLEIAKTNGAEVYLTQWWWLPDWLGGQKKINDYRKFARTTADALEYLIEKKGFTNINYYCFAVELSYGSHLGGRGYYSMEEFRSITRALVDELKKRGKPELVKMVATDEPGDWSTIKWAAENMDDITGAYCGHIYSADPAVIKATFDRGVSYSKSKGKKFIVGEFGVSAAAEDTMLSDPSIGLVYAEYGIATLNSGIYGICNWTFNDAVYDFGLSGVPVGLFKDKKNGFSIRPAYYAYGLFTKYFRPNSTSFEVTTPGSGVVAGAVRNNTTSRYSLAILNRRDHDVDVAVRLEGDPVRTALSKYLYDPKRVPAYDGGKLQGPAGEVQVVNGIFSDSVPARCVVVYAPKEGLGR
jgi:hypothetical protein